MQKKQVEKWVWILIYGGMLGISLGWFLEPTMAAGGWALMVVGGAAAAAGLVLIFVRARMGP
jgi:F0F1-type ATP synthase assembly protein I